jgi:DNA polymerase III subunit epsilon
VRASNASGRRAARKTKPALRPAAQVAPVEDHIHRVFVAREEERCRKLETEYARDPKKARKKVARRPVLKPWLRPMPQALLQDPDLLLLVTDYDYDLADPGFQEYCRSRGVFHVAGEEGSKRREFFRNHALTKDAFLSDESFRVAQPLDGKRYEYTTHEMEVAWEIVCLGRAQLQDCWELYRSSAATGGLVGAQEPARAARSSVVVTARFVALDVETANADRSSICQIGAVRVEDGAIVGTLRRLVDPETFFDTWNIAIHGITETDVRGQPRFPELAGVLNEFVGDLVVASHTSFDRVAVERAHKRYGLTPPAWPWLDTACVARGAWSDRFGRSGYGLRAVAAFCGIEFLHHDALEDARAAALILLRAIDHTGCGIERWQRRAFPRIELRPDGRHGASIACDGNPDGPLAGEEIVFTGTLTMPRPEAAALAASFGCNVREGLTRHTTILVVGMQDLSKLRGYSKSTKHRKAEQLIAQGVPIDILSEEDFMALVKLQSD